MSPAIKCEGCNFKVRTASEPATEKQLEQLFVVWLDHKNNSIHRTDIKFHKTTPSVGFENAQVVEETVEHMRGMY